ncbi:exodeoxyribonuclease V subunit alpha [Calidifontibacter terrae]
MTESRISIATDGELRALNDAGFLDGSDVLVARRVTTLLQEGDPAATLALAFTIRAVREGSTALDLASVQGFRAAAGSGDLLEAESGEGPASIVDLPAAAEWLERVAASQLVAAGVLRVDLGLVYLDRYHADECRIADALVARSQVVLPAIPVLPEHLPPDLTEQQLQAASSVAARATTVLTGGPGTGKTHTIAGVLSAVTKASHGNLRIALAAPTGKAAARMTESLATVAPQLDSSLHAVTLHRLLGFLPRNRQRFQHNARNPLPHDLVIVDEASMVSLSLMARLIEALPPPCRLLLVGDPDQLASVEAGSVLADVVRGLDGSGQIVALTHDHRLGGGRADLARAFRAGDQQAVLAAIDAAGESVTFVETDTPSAQDLAPVLRHAVELRQAAVAGDADAALDLLGRSRLLCAHRSGPFGTGRWNRLIEQALSEQFPEIGHQPMYFGRPVLITRNDYALGVFNGDTGVIIRGADGRPVALVDTGSGRREISPWRLSDIETMHAMTVHKAQGSQAEQVTVLVPPIDSPLLTRELLYTAVTRAQKHLTIVGARPAVLKAVETPVLRSSGLTRRLNAAAENPGPDPGGAAPES